MKISEITIDIVKQYSRIENNDDNVILAIILDSAKSHVLFTIGITETIADTKSDLALALLVLCNDMYEHREYIVENNKVNIVVKNIIDKYSINLL